MDILKSKFNKKIGKEVNNKEDNIKQLKVIPADLREKLMQVEMDVQLFNLGFEYFGPLKECEGFETTYERIHICYKEEADGVYITTFSDLGNSYSNVLEYDVNVQEVLDKVNATT